MDDPSVIKKMKNVLLFLKLGEGRNKKKMKNTRFCFNNQRNVYVEQQSKKNTRKDLLVTLAEREKKIVFLLSRKIGTIKVKKRSLIKSPSFESSVEEKVICLPKAFKCPSMLI